MAFFKKNNQNYSTTVNRTVMVNGKVVSENDPEVEAMMGDMKKTFGGFFDADNGINENSDPNDIGKFVENALRMAGIPESGQSIGSGGTSPSLGSQPRVLQCKGCGARNMIAPGTNPICEYCGSGLE